MEFTGNHTDNKINPFKGWLANLSITSSIRQVIPNDAILSVGDASGFNFRELYNKANENKFQLKVNMLAAWYFPIIKNIVAKIQYQGGYIDNKTLFRNELFQIGGFHSLRGFDENGFFATQYHIASMEVHFELGGNNYFYLFNDDALVVTKFQEFYKKDFPISFGLGISLENKTGIFNIAFAVGKHYKSPFEFRNTKIHFGYAAYF